MTAEELLLEIQKVYTVLKQLEGGVVITDQAEASAPAISAKKSIQKNQIICLICGKGGFKTLARHLNTVHDTKPAAYCKRFGLPAGTALAAKAYSASLRESALKNNLGEKLSKGRKIYQAIQAEKKQTTPTKPTPEKINSPRKKAVK